MPNRPLNYLVATCWYHVYRKGKDRVPNINQYLCWRQKLKQKLKYFERNMHAFHRCVNTITIFNVYYVKLADHLLWKTILPRWTNISWAGFSSIVSRFSLRTIHWKVCTLTKTEMLSFWNICHLSLFVPEVVINMEYHSLKQLLIHAGIEDKQCW